MPIDDWDEIRTAYQVARLGTVSAAAEALGVHHATVIRHVDALEAQLGARLFQRHARGYTPTEAGRDLLTVARATDENFSQLANRIRGLAETVSGELVVTSVPGLAPFLSRVFAAYLTEHPQVDLRYRSGARVFRLEFGEAHVAIRAGTAPQEPDNVVQPFMDLQFGLFAAPAYVKAHGQPTAETLWQHRFVVQEEDNRAPFAQWVARIAPGARQVLHTTDANDTSEAVKAGAGLGFLALRPAPDPGAGLIHVPTPGHEFVAQTWLVTHVDLHRTVKVQSFLRALKAAAAEMGADVGAEPGAEPGPGAGTEAAS